MTSGHYLIPFWIKDTKRISIVVTHPSWIIMTRTHSKNINLLTMPASQFENIIPSVYLYIHRYDMPLCLYTLCHAQERRLTCHPAYFYAIITCFWVIVTHMTCTSHVQDQICKIHMIMIISSLCITPDRHRKSINTALCLLIKLEKVWHKKQCSGKWLLISQKLGAMTLLKVPALPVKPMSTLKPDGPRTQI